MAGGPRDGDSNDVIRASSSRVDDGNTVAESEVSEGGIVPAMILYVLSVLSVLSVLDVVALVAS